MTQADSRANAGLDADREASYQWVRSNTSTQ